MKKPFFKQIQSIQKSPLTMNIAAAILCYFSLVIGLFYFIIKDKKTIWEAFLLGFYVYIVYETTNLAILKNWTWNIAIIDTLWGGILYALTTAIIYRIYKT
jgi:uncharacterized membrane protein